MIAPSCAGDRVWTLSTVSCAEIVLQPQAGAGILPADVALRPADAQADEIAVELEVADLDRALARGRRSWRDRAGAIVLIWKLGMARWTAAPLARIECAEAKAGLGSATARRCRRSSVAASCREDRASAARPGDGRRRGLLRRRCRFCRRRARSCRRRGGSLRAPSAAKARVSLVAPSPRAPKSSGRSTGAALKRRRRRDQCRGARRRRERRADRTPGSHDCRQRLNRR